MLIVGDAMKTVVITGSTRGIGFGMAREFLKRDYRVVISSRGRGQVEERVTALGAEFSRERIYGLACNVSDRTYELR
jgi:NAD(P)-dependent dehydrogenase (short-subunit alcohol dehydrogenase family)